jgi:hypothetical protein
MTKRKIKKYFTKRKIIIKRTRKCKKIRVTRKNKYKRGGEASDEYKEKNQFRRTLNNFIIQIKNRKNIQQAVNSIIKTFEKNKLINTLIPVTAEGKPIDKETYSLAKRPVAVYDFVSPVTVILDNLTGILSDEDIVKLLNVYFLNGGNFNNLSSRFKDSPFKHEVNKNRINNVKMLLNKSNPFHIIEDGLDEETKIKLAELIPNEQQIISQEPIIQEPIIKEPLIKEPIIQEPVIQEPIIQEPVSIINEKLILPSPLPQDNTVGYDRTTVPEFWKPIFQNGEELLQIREKFMGIYEIDEYKSDIQKRIKICDLLETIIPGYLTKYSLGFRETAKTLVNTNILNCFITLFYVIILYRLYDTKQD